MALLWMAVGSVNPAARIPLRMGIGRPNEANDTNPPSTVTCVEIKRWLSVAEGSPPPRAAASLRKYVGPGRRATPKMRVDDNVRKNLGHHPSYRVFTMCCLAI